MSNDYLGQERRKFKRIKVNLSLMYRKTEPMEVRIRTADSESTAPVLDISEGGVCILTSANLPIGSTLWIRFTLSHPQKKGVGYFGTVELLGQVRYTAAAGPVAFRVGVSFVKVDEVSKKDIMNFIQTVDGEDKNSV